MEKTLKEIKERDEAINAFKELVDDTFYHLYHGRELLIRKEETEEEAEKLKVELDMHIAYSEKEALKKFTEMSDDELVERMLMDVIQHMDVGDVLEIARGGDLCE